MAGGLRGCGCATLTLADYSYRGARPKLFATCSITEVQGSHAVYVSQPQAVALLTYPVRIPASEAP